MAHRSKTRNISINDQRYFKPPRAAHDDIQTSVTGRTGKELQPQHKSQEDSASIREEQSDQHSIPQDGNTPHKTTFDAASTIPQQQPSLNKPGSKTRTPPTMSAVTGSPPQLSMAAVSSAQLCAVLDAYNESSAYPPITSTELGAIIAYNECALYPHITEDTTLEELDTIRAYVKNDNLDPPITLASLAELDTQRVFNNPKLRQDVNFDKELHFRPNTDGAKGKKKSQASERYYKAFAHELHLIEHLLGQWMEATDATELEEVKQALQKCSKRLPKIFAAVRDILKSLVPEREQVRIEERLDVDFLMKQIHSGCCDLVDLAAWLAGMIKTHCAPMRDVKADAMVKTIEQAVTESSTRLLATGMKQLGDLMEYMKLDVANHQIRHVRPLLIKNTIDFQQRYNQHRIQIGRLDTNAALHWLQSEMDLVHNAILPGDELEAICSGLLWDLISPKGAHPYCATFYLDFDRLRQLSIEFEDLIYRDMCHGILLDLLPEATAYHAEAWIKLKDYLATFTQPLDYLRRYVENIAAEMAKIVGEAPNTNLTFNQARVAQEAENRLWADLRSESALFGRYKAVWFHRVLPKLQVSVHRHERCTTLELQDALVPQVTRPSTTRSHGVGAILVPAQPDDDPSDEDASLVRRLTLIIVLHWQVWADMLYIDRVNYEPMPDYVHYHPPSRSSTPESSIDLNDTEYASGLAHTPSSSLDSAYSDATFNDEASKTDSVSDISYEDKFLDESSKTDTEDYTESATDEQRHIP